VTFDVRSPEEFTNGHLPGTINLPLLSNEDRMEVGKMYQSAGPEKAFDLALERVFPNLTSILRRVGKHTSSQKHILIYCKHGGMQSQSMASFLSSQGYNVNVLEGGYKAFRRWTLTEFEKPQKVCVIGGATGIGKTDMLAQLKILGMQIIDLEALACHKGSVFRRLGENIQPTSEQFGNHVAVQWSRLESHRFVFLEDEGARIGTVVLPAPLYERMRTPQLIIHLKTPFSVQSKRSMAIYGKYGHETLATILDPFRRHIGNARTDELLHCLAEGDPRTVCEEVLRTYDRFYRHHLMNNRSLCTVVKVPVCSLDSVNVAQDVVTVAGPLEALTSSKAFFGPFS